GATDKFNHRVREDSLGKIGTVEQQPIAQRGPCHHGQPANTLRPFWGHGDSQPNFPNENIADLGGTARLETAKCSTGTLGLASNINATWFARTDVRYMHARPELRVGGQGTGQDLDLDPWTVGVGIGARF